MDELDKAIKDLRKKIERWTRQAEEGRVSLAAMELAAKLRPLDPNAVRRPADAEDGAFEAETSDLLPAEAEDSRRPGRRPGAISADWREVLHLLWMVGGAYSYPQIHDAARQCGIDIKDIASTRDRVRSFVANSLMSGTPETGFTVTEDAAERFGFKRDSALAGENPTRADEVEEF
jgi:hypothetical protein